MEMIVHKQLLIVLWVLHWSISFTDRKTRQQRRLHTHIFVYL